MPPSHENARRLAGESKTTGLQVLPSKANFPFVRHAWRDAEDVQQRLQQLTMRVRRFPRLGTNEFLRTSIETPQACKDPLAALRETLQQDFSSSTTSA